jgi:hypothetical protein
MGVLTRRIRFGWSASGAILIASACSQGSSPTSSSPGDAGPADVTTAGDGAADDVSTPTNVPDGGGAATDAGTGVADAGPRPDAGRSSDAASDAMPDADAGTISYSTSFSLTESPISESGRWIHRGTPWALVDTAGGVAYGTQPGDGSYTDSYAHLSGFPPDVTVTATVHLNAGLSPGGTREVEIHLRWADTTTSARGYECNLAYNGGYAEVVRWNGPLGSYTYVSPQGSGGPGAVHDGDVFKAQIVGNVITTWLNTKQLQHVDVSSIGGTVWSDGDPGMGFWRGAGASATPGDYGFSSFSAASIP